MRNFISHEYLSVDPEVIFATVKIRLVPLLTDLRHVLADIDNVLQENPKEGEKKIANAMENRLVKVLVGQRRSGKSFIMRQLMNYLITEKQVEPRQLLYVNFEFAPFGFVRNADDLLSLYQLYRKEKLSAGKIYLFLDEIQNIAEWEKAVNSLSQDYTEDCEIVITGSNSKMLSSQLSALLSGRYIEFKVFPFNIEEYALISERNVNKDTYMEFLKSGGFPELFHLNNFETKRNYISSIKDTVLLRDIVQRNNIKDARLLEDIFGYLVNNASNLISVNNVVNFFKSKGRKTNYETVSNYILYLEEANLLHRAERYNIKGKDIISGTCKYYANDLAFHNYLYNGYGIGYLLENRIYLDLKIAGYDVYVGVIKDREVDFVATKADRIIYLQVSYLLIDDSTTEREYAPFDSLTDHYEKFVVTLDEITLPSKNGVKHIQAWNIYNYI